MSVNDTFKNENMEGIAVIGMAGRFPGAKSINDFWRNLKDGVESISILTDEDILNSAIDPAILNNPRHVKAGAVLEDIELFDAAFFGFNPREAAIMDPQHRFFLECSWQALEDAGYDSENFAGEIGIYGGMGWNSYLLFNIASNRNLLSLEIGQQTLLGNEKDFLTTRTSYKLNLKGPSINVQTGCSTSLVSIYLASQSLLSYQCDMALAGGVSINVLQKAGYLHQEGGIMSPDGHCRTFDAKARGTVGGSGVGVVVLKRLEDALTDGDCIHAVIKGSAINNDGALKVGYTAPSLVRQAQAIAQALAVADIDTETVNYVECHGSGTVLGDPVEMKALTKAFRTSTQKKNFCAIGSVKTNVGHLDAAAGIAGFIKTVLALKHKLIPPSLHFEEPNPEIDFNNSPFYVNTKLSEWKTNGTPRRAGVSSFGIGGTNAHIILEEAPVEEQGAGGREQGRKYQLLVLSAKTESALETATANLVNHLKQHSNLNLADVAYTLKVGRRAMAYRRVVVCQDVDDAVNALQDPKRVLTSIQETSEYAAYTPSLADGLGDRPVALMFPGLGTHYTNMALELYQVEPTFQEAVDRCCLLLKPLLGLDLRDVLYPKNSSQKQNSPKPGLDLRKMLGRSEEPADEATQKLNQTFLTQPAIFVVEYALAQLWFEWGIRPMAMIGYSIGEFVAATLAGVLSLEDALTLVAKRAQMIQELPAGAMLAVPLTEQEVQPFLSEKLSLSAINGSSLCVISGCTEAIDELERHLTQKGLACRRIVTSHAFHSKMMEAIAPTLHNLVKTFNLQPPKIPYLSTVTGTWITAEQTTDPNYWVNHTCQAVQFASAVQELSKKHNPVLLEVGPGQTLNSLALSIFQSDRLADRVVLPSLRHSYERQSDTAFLLNTLGQLWLAGVQIDWAGFYSHQRRNRLPLPTYPFERQRYWIEPHKQTQVVAISQTYSPEHFQGGDAQEYQLPTNSETVSELSLHSRPHLRNSYIAPSSELEQNIAKLYQQLLGIEQVGIYDNFFELGGNSLIGIQVIAQLRKDFQLELSLRALFEAPSVAELALFIEEMILAELEELTEDEAQEVVSVIPKKEQALITVSQQSYRLPNNLEIVHLSKAETDYFYKDIFENQVYLKYGITLNNGDCIFDVGSHIGLFTLFVNQQCKNARIYAFEPALPLLEISRANTKRYEVNAKLFNCGLSDESKVATLTFYPNSSGMSSFYPHREEEKSVLKAIMLNQLQNDLKSIENLIQYSDELLEERFKSQSLTCQMRTLSDVLGEQNVERIDLLKIDAYKSELNVIKGIKDEDWKKIKQIVIKVGDKQGPLEQITDLLKIKSYKVVVKKENLYENSAMYYVYAQQK